MCTYKVFERVERALFERIRVVSQIFAAVTTICVLVHAQIGIVLHGESLTPYVYHLLPSAQSQSEPKSSNTHANSPLYTAPSPDSSHRNLSPYKTSATRLRLDNRPYHIYTLSKTSIVHIPHPHPYKERACTYYHPVSGTNHASHREFPF